MTNLPEAPFSYTHRGANGALLTVRGGTYNEFILNMSEMFGEMSTELLLSTHITGDAEQAVQNLRDGGVLPGGQNEKPQNQQPKTGERMLGTSSTSGNQVWLNDGKYGWYVTDKTEVNGKKVYAKLAKFDKQESMTLERAEKLIAERTAWMEQNS